MRLGRLLTVIGHDCIKLHVDFGHFKHKELRCVIMLCYLKTECNFKLAGKSSTLLFYPFPNLGKKFLNASIIYQKFCILLFYTTWYTFENVQF